MLGNIIMSDIKSLFVFNISLFDLYRAETVLTDCQSFPVEILVPGAEIWDITVEHGVHLHEQVLSANRIHAQRPVST